MHLQMTNSVVVEGEAPESDDELPVMPRRTKPTKVSVVEGEAPETDDEIDTVAPTTSSTAVEPTTAEMPVRSGFIVGPSSTET